MLELYNNQLMLAMAFIKSFSVNHVRWIAVRMVHVTMTAKQCGVRVHSAKVAINAGTVRATFLFFFSFIFPIFTSKMSFAYNTFVCCGTDSNGNVYGKGE